MFNNLQRTSIRHLMANGRFIITTALHTLREDSEDGFRKANKVWQIRLYNRYAERPIDLKCKS